MKSILYKAQQAMMTIRVAESMDHGDANDQR